ncbi:uncharacterized protein [Symphalangus syndactylus]|uniref:uncharacterized protein n=1 Tax=Symphalangus syndactylus TaxID=9590 RepID=UPI002441B927|nr:uncharacterized protein LOC129492788 [Symphalangus syndactylus]
MLMSAGGCCEALDNTPVLILSSYPVGGARTQRKEIFGGLDEGTGKEEPGFFGKLAAAVAYGKLKSLSNLILCIFILDLLKKIKRQGLPLLWHSIDERHQWSSPPPPQAWNLGNDWFLSFHTTAEGFCPHLILCEVCWTYLPESSEDDVC